MRCGELVFVAETLAEVAVRAPRCVDAAGEPEGLDGMLHLLGDFLVLRQMSVADKRGVFVSRLSSIAMVLFPCHGLIIKEWASESGA